MQSALAGNLLEHLAQISDPRGRQGRRFSLSAMLATVVCATLCGARGYESIAGWIHAQQPQIWHWLDYLRKPPCANSFRDLLMALSPAELETAVRGWMTAVLGHPPAEGSLQAVAMDGKSLRGTCAAGQQLIHLLSVLDHATGCVLSQMQVADKWRQGKQVAETDFAITSVPRPQASAAQLLAWRRGHWGIENRLHRVRDMAWGEDHCRVRSGRAPQILSAVRNAALNFLRTAGLSQITVTLREHAYRVDRLLARLGIMNH